MVFNAFHSNLYFFSPRASAKTNPFEKAEIPKSTTDLSLKGTLWYFFGCTVQCFKRMLMNVCRNFMKLTRQCKHLPISAENLRNLPKICDISGRMRLLLCSSSMLLKSIQFSSSTLDFLGAGPGRGARGRGCPRAGGQPRRAPALPRRARRRAGRRRARGGRVSAAFGAPPALEFLSA